MSNQDNSPQEQHSNSSRKFILGADPGKHGAVVLYNIHDRSEVILIPSKVTKDGMLDTSYLLQELKPYASDICIAAMEKVHALFGSSAAGTFSFGEAVGSLRTVLSLLRDFEEGAFEFIEVQPKIWQKVAWAGTDVVKGEAVINSKTGVPKVLKNGEIRRKTDTKATSLKAAGEIFHGVSFVPKRCRIVHDGCIDAALIAYYAELYYTGKLKKAAASSSKCSRRSARASAGSRTKLP